MVSRQHRNINNCIFLNFLHIWINKPHFNVHDHIEQYSSEDIQVDVTCIFCSSSVILNYIRILISFHFADICSVLIHYLIRFQYVLCKSLFIVIYKTVFWPKRSFQNFRRVEKEVSDIDSGKSAGSKDSSRVSDVMVVM